MRRFMSDRSLRQLASLCGGRECVNRFVMCRSHADQGLADVLVWSERHPPPLDDSWGSGRQELLCSHSRSSGGEKPVWRASRVSSARLTTRVIHVFTAARAGPLWCTHLLHSALQCLVHFYTPNHSRSLVLAFSSAEPVIDSVNRSYGADLWNFV